MRENICIVLNAKNKKEALKEMHETINLFREDCHIDTEYTLDERYWTKSYFEQEYEDRKQEYRDLSPENIEKRLKRSGCKDIEEYIQMVFEKVYKWGTFEDYVRQRHNIIRFEGEKCIGLYNPKGYIDYVDHIVGVKKYKNISPTDLKNYRIAKLIYKNKESLDWDMDKDYKTNKMLLRQALRHEAKSDDYIAIVRVHF